MERSGRGRTREEFSGSMIAGCLLRNTGLNPGSPARVSGPFSWTATIGYGQAPPTACFTAPPQRPTLGHFASSESKIWNPTPGKISLRQSSTSEVGFGLQDPEAWHACAMDDGHDMA